MKLFLQSSFHYLLLLLFDLNFAVFLEKRVRQKGDHIKVILEEQSPSLITCSHVCLRLKSDPVFKDEICKCVKHEEGGSSTDVIANEPYYKQIKMKRNDCQPGFGRDISAINLKSYTNIDRYQRCRMLCSLYEGCRGWVYIPAGYADRNQEKRCYLKDNFNPSATASIFYGRPCE